MAKKSREKSAPEPSEDPEPTIGDSIDYEDGVLTIKSERARKVTSLEPCFATDDENVIMTSFSLVVDTLHATGDGDDDRKQTIRAAAAMLKSIAPKDDVEAMLAAQMVAAHFAAMRMSKLLVANMGVEQIACLSNQANKFMRTYAAHAETLKKYRAKASQTVRVDHVHVNEGGQAIVGDVHPQGGTNAKTGDQAHAIGYAPGTPMPCQDEAENVVPIASDEERPVSHARREVHGRAEGE